MPELPDITVYLEALDQRIARRVLEKIRVVDMFVLRTAIPPIDSLVGRQVVELRRIGKRIVIGFENDLWLVIHLMIAGRLHWADAGGKRVSKNVLAEFFFGNGTLTLTEAGSKRRASVHLVETVAALSAHHPGGIEVFDCSL